MFGLDRFHCIGGKNNRVQQLSNYTADTLNLQVPPGSVVKSANFNCKNFTVFFL